MLRHTATLIALVAIAAACTPDTPTGTEAATLAAATPAAAVVGAEGLVRKTMPDEDPGPPFYARVTTILNQFFHDDGLLAIPFYRPPSCVPSDFNMLTLFDPPGPGGPGAFACPLLMTGFLLIEPDAPLGTFPRLATLAGSDVPFWLVDWEQFQAEAADGVVTITDLQAMDPLMGTADRYHETLMPREGDHRIIIDASGTLADGRAFRFHVTHLESRTRAVEIQLR